MADPDSPRIIQDIRNEPKGAVKISSDLDIPVSSVYRKLATLREAGLIFPKSYEITKEGKKQELYLSSVSEIKLDFRGDSIVIDLIPSTEIVNRIWVKLFGSSGQRTQVD
jgi:predicted transcriptional regulator